MEEDKGSGNSDTLLCDSVEVTVALWAPIFLSLVQMESVCHSKTGVLRVFPDIEGDSLPMYVLRDTLRTVSMWVVV